MLSLNPNSWNPTQGNFTNPTFQHGSPASYAPPAPAFQSPGFQFGEFFQAFDNLMKGWSAFLNPEPAWGNFKQHGHNDFINNTIDDVSPKGWGNIKDHGHNDYIDNTIDDINPHKVIGDWTGDVVIDDVTPKGLYPDDVWYHDFQDDVTPKDLYPDDVWYHDFQDDVPPMVGTGQPGFVGGVDPANNQVAVTTVSSSVGAQPEDNGNVTNVIVNPSSILSLGQDDNGVEVQADNLDNAVIGPGLGIAVEKQVQNNDQPKAGFTNFAGIGLSN